MTRKRANFVTGLAVLAVCGLFSMIGAPGWAVLLTAGTGAVAGWGTLRGLDYDPQAAPGGARPPENLLAAAAGGCAVASLHLLWQVPVALFALLGLFALLQAPFDVLFG